MLNIEKKKKIDGYRVKKLQSSLFLIIHDSKAAASSHKSNEACLKVPRRAEDSASRGQALFTGACQWDVSQDIPYKKTGCKREKREGGRGGGEKAASREKLWFTA